MPAALVENSQVICEVWASNLEEEMRKIRETVLSYSYIAMVSRPSPAKPGQLKCLEPACFCESRQLVSLRRAQLLTQVFVIFL